MFADEVEPTGAVPMELSLERYRFAALPDKFRRERVAEDRRLQPRVTRQLFAGSQLLAGAAGGRLQQLLCQWYGDAGQRWRLVFRASAHEHSAHAFHRLCDGVAPTFTVCLVSPQTTVRSVQFTLYSVQYTVYSSQYLHGIQFARSQ